MLNDISIGSAVFFRAHDCDGQTARQTDRPFYSVYVTVCRTCVRCTAMRPKTTFLTKEMFEAAMLCNFLNLLQKCTRAAKVGL